MVPDVTPDGSLLMSALGHQRTFRRIRLTSALHSKAADLIAGLVLAISTQNCALFIGTPGTGPGMMRSNSPVPIKTALAPISPTEFVCDLDRLDPFGVLAAELGRGAQPQRIAERVGDDIARR